MYPELAHNEKGSRGEKIQKQTPERYQGFDVATCPVMPLLPPYLATVT